MAPVRSPAVGSVRIRTVAAIVGRALLGVVVAVLLASAILLLLAYYADFSFNLQALVIAVLAAGVVVFLWTRWR
jgi:uncharacterized membrane protein YeaQ/YmgE (transglycosylase-associated protein family)